MDVLEGDDRRAGVANDEGRGEFVVGCFFFAGAFNMAVESHDEFDFVAEDDGLAEFEGYKGFEVDPFGAGINGCLESLAGGAAVGPLRTLGRADGWDFINGKVERCGGFSRGIERET